MKRVCFPILLLFCAARIFCVDIQNDIVQKAQRYIGCAYSTGGVQPPAFDCSGFVGYIVRPFVPNLPRLSKDMSDMGMIIPKEELAPGDLVFFATTSTPNAVSHVALYIGQDSIIHAISDGPDRGVNITSLSTRYWKEHYYSAVRVFPAHEGKTAKKTAAVETGKPIQFAKGTYTGGLRDNEPDGKGTLLLNNGDAYTGSFAGGKINGKGTYLWADGSKYEGEFRDDRLHGKGTLTDAKGNRQEVAYSDGEPISKPETKKAPAAATAAPEAQKETYLQKKDSPWDTWTGYIAGDFDAWKAKEQQRFEASKKPNVADEERKAYEEWKKKNGR